MAVLPDGRAERPGEGPRLDVGHPQLAVAHPPGWLVRIDPQPQDARSQLVACGGALWCGPVRQVVRHPLVGIQGRIGEILVERQLVACPVKRIGMVTPVRVRGMGHAEILTQGSKSNRSACTCNREQQTPRGPRSAGGRNPDRRPAPHAVFEPPSSAGVRKGLSDQTPSQWASNEPPAVPAFILCGSVGGQLRQARLARHAAAKPRPS